MRLASAALSLLLRKLGVFIGVLLSLFVAYLLVETVVPSFRDAVAERERLEAVIEKQESLNATLGGLEKTEIKRRDHLCGFRAKVIAKPAPGNVCKDAQRALDAVEEEQDKVEKKLAKANAEKERLRLAQESGVGWVVNRWANSWRWLCGIALLVFFLPPVLRTVGYFLLMPLVTLAHKPIHLAAGSERDDASLRARPAERTLPVSLPPGEVLSARSEHVRPVRGKVRSRLIYDWTMPFVSFAAGLYGLSRITGDEDGTEATLSTPDDPNAYLMRIDFRDHPGLVMRPRHVVGVIGVPELSTRWRWGIQALATWQVRYIMFAGTGSLIVQGSGDVVPTSPGDRATRMEQHLVMGFDSRLTVGVNRTEVFWPYLWGRTPLVDDEFTGAHPIFWQKSSVDGPSNPIAKAFDAFFSSFGKLLGF
ncbi:hypothetical protein [Aeromicrobium duanguangcaii]|uniref:hypothetical protein n=1 Tax=Aeromicrobium duanguangcaii TaxID=2968086 RepID=UPI002016EC48|nr:hypothetical protein [Aeromicrobium duanguangcaii]MCL3836860.1 hypothetical protein [Aeromicrobium duanguangcaii]